MRLPDKWNRQQKPLFRLADYTTTEVFNGAGKAFIIAGEHEACSALVQVSFRIMSTGGYNLAVSTQFLDRLASQLKVGKDPVCSRAIERVLDVIKKSYEDGQYQNATEAERDFRRLVERDETGK